MENRSVIWRVCVKLHKLKTLNGTSSILVTANEDIGKTLVSCVQFQQEQNEIFTSLTDS